MLKLARPVLALLALWALLTTVPAGAQAGSSLRIDRLDTSSYPELRLYATVTDAQRRTLGGLTAENFVLVENGQAVPITSVGNASPETLDLRVALAIDISGSIAPVLDQVKQAAVEFVESLQPNDQVALILFGDESRPVNDFSTDHGAVIASIQGLSPATLEASTALYNGAFEAVRLTANQTSGRRAVVLLTDGYNLPALGTTSLALSDVQREATANSVPLYVIGVGPDVAEQELRLLASSGRYYPVEQPAAVATAYRNIGEQLRQQYEIRYFSDLPPDGQVHELELKLNVPELGAAAASTSLQITPPEIPLVRVALPSEITLGEPATIQAQIFALNPPRSAELLLDDTVIASETIGEAAWAYTWVPNTSLDPGTYQLDVRVTDSSGVQSSPAPRSVILAAPQTPLLRAELPEQITLTQPITLTADILARNPPLTLQLLVDGQGVVTDTLSGRAWTYLWTPDSALPTGERQIELRVTDSAGTTGMPITRTATLIAPAGLPWLWIGLGAAVLLLLGGFGGLFMLRTRRSKHEHEDMPVEYPAAAATGAFMSAPRFIEPTELADSPRVESTELADQPQSLPTALLIVEQGQAHPNELRLVADREAQLGRQASSDLVLDDTRASARHALIRFQENGFTIVDLGSTNGLRVNGQRTERMRLQDGDRIAIGAIVLVFKQMR